MLIVAKARCFLVVHRCHTLRPALSTTNQHKGLAGSSEYQRKSYQAQRRA